MAPKRVTLLPKALGTSVSRVFSFLEGGWQSLLCSQTTPALQVGSFQTLSVPWTRDLSSVCMSLSLS